MLAWLSGQSDLVEAFAKGEDVYKIMASAIYAKDESEITKEERFVGKTTILGAGYGMGAKKFGAQLKTFGMEIQEGEAIRIINVYRQTYPSITGLWTQGKHTVEAMAKNQNTPFGNGCVEVHGDSGILLPNGLYQRYPNLRKIKAADGDQYVYDSRRGAVKIYGGKLVENICQALARCIIGEQMLKIAKKYRPVLTVHDAVACIAPEGEVEEAVAYVEECMRWTPDWAVGLPVNCEAGYGKTYGDC
jgi:DNA polymerase